MKRRMVLAVGGNGLIKNGEHREIDDQLAAVQEIAGFIADIMQLGFAVTVTHGNGPQVGYIFRRSELAFEAGELHFVPLKNCVADTQGAIGYQLQESLHNTFHQRGMVEQPVAMVTMVEVDGNDPSFQNPTKPIGVFYPKQKVDSLLRKHSDWHIVYQKGRGYRRVVPSPRPIRIVEMEALKTMMDSGFVVIAAGGGGIPVDRDGDGNLVGVNCVVDKDLTAALMAIELKADLLVISTQVESVYLDFDSPQRKALQRLTVAEAYGRIGQGHFGPGTMLPKIEAALKFISHGGKEVIITSPENLVAAVQGKKGTRIVP
ncbi:carbamate kinase [Desulfomarina profundi]|uniref:Carbamate kinase n=1 Tax=Desulfomarina profundi TaxID=2772557 RepID=A0A8D5JIA6_9BACT|nr:carbamate kinase [Desulfomarina profundi]BCL62479.1 carbamate kinase [Desulfomarina profundi]